ncbi:MAG: alpha/beta hydrolase [Lachnospiraceae bacterium]|nr:alpha/beta hydrolase [Lachnospiraceae bacterium]
MREFTIDSRDMKTRLACYAWEPKGDPRAIIVLVHGMGDHALRYTEMAEYFMAEGILVAALDLLGHGSSAATPEDFGYFCEQDPATVIVRDVHRLKKTIQAEHPGVPIYLMGHSMGSYIARNYIERYGTGIQGVIIQGGGDTGTFKGMYGKLVTDVIALFHGWRYRSMFCASKTLGSFVRAFPDEGKTGWLTSNRELIEQYEGDPKSSFVFTLNGFHTLAELILRARKKKLIRNIPKTLPMFILSGAEDPVGEMGRGVQRMYEMYKNEGIERIRLDIRPGDRHELHHEEDRYQVFEEIKDFILGE